MERYKNNLEFFNQDSVRLGPRLEIVVAGPQVDDVPLLGAVELVAFGPVVARGVREDLPAAGERATRDRLVHRLRRLQFRARILENQYSTLNIFYKR